MKSRAGNSSQLGNNGLGKGLGTGNCFASCKTQSREEVEVRLGKQFKFNLSSN